MNGQDGNTISFAELKSLIGDHVWSLYQFQIEEQSHDNIKLLFEDLPGKLIADFFQNNFINNLIDSRSSKGWIDLWATGLDNVTWHYRLSPSSKIK